MMPMVSSLTPLHSLRQDYQIELQHDFFSYVMPLAFVWHDTNGTVSDTWHWCQHWYQYCQQRSYNTIKQASQCYQCNDVTDGMISSMLSLCICQNLIFLSNATNMPHISINSCPHDTSMSVYMPYMNAMQSTIWKGTLVYIHFILLTYALEQI